MTMHHGSAYREDLARLPDNGWSLFGLFRALDSQGKKDEALATRKEFERVWAGADEPTLTSCKRAALTPCPIRRSHPTAPWPSTSKTP